MEFLAQSFRIGLGLVALVAGSVLLAPTQPALLTAHEMPEPERMAALEAPGPAQVPPAAETPPAVKPAPSSEPRTDAQPGGPPPAAQTDETVEPAAVAEAPAEAAVEPPFETAVEPPAEAPAEDFPPVDTAEALEGGPVEPSAETTASIEADVAALDAPPAPTPQPLGLAELTAEPPPLDFRLYREPEVAAATRLRAAGSSIQIAGVEPLPADAACADGARCGTQAREAVDAFLGGRAVICSVPIGRGDNPDIIAPCLVGEEDIGEWIVANGWAPASAGSRYKDEEEKARAEGLGIWANGGLTRGD